MRRTVHFAAVVTAILLSGCAKAGASDVTVIGGADGPTAIFMASEADREEDKSPGTNEEEKAVPEQQEAEPEEPEYEAAFSESFESDTKKFSSGDNKAEGKTGIYEDFINDKEKCGGQTFSEIYSYLVDLDSDMIPECYYYDVDEDGEDELLVNGVYYGYDIYDIHDGVLCRIAQGSGTAEICQLYKANGHVYIGHSDFSHGGRQMLDLVRIDATGKEIETISINAEYWDNPDDRYDENSDFTYNGEKITMKEYEDYMNSFVRVDIEELRK